ncbi:hypothetical protein [Photorhabdus laumondii]
MTGVSECSQQRGNLKDDGYKRNSPAGAAIYPRNGYSESPLSGRWME